MTQPVICKSTRNNTGCGHPVTDHDGNTARACCCCNWRHNDPAHVVNCVPCNVRRVKRELGVPAGGTEQAHVIAQHLPNHLRGPFWESAIERYFEAKLQSPDGTA